MALFSSKTLLWARTGLFAWVSYLLLVNPRAVLDYSGLVLLASAMDMPLLLVNDKSPIYGSIGVLLFFLVLSDLAALVDSNVAYLETAVLFRLALSFALCLFCYLADHRQYVYVCNSVVFAFAFAEVWFGILTYSVLKEEKLQRAREIVKESEDTRQKYEIGQLSPEEREEFEKKLDQEEYQRLMSEFN